MASAKQLAARRKFAKIMKSGGFKKRKSLSRTTKTVTKTRTVKRKSSTPKRKTNKAKTRRTSVKRNSLKSITGSNTIKKVALGIGGGVLATTILSTVMPNSSFAKFASPLGAYALGGLEGIIGQFALSMLGSRTGSNANALPAQEAL
tara:strand:- start:410 stop:850 length:441 start_codon:yes stop_codon:yes gene_type:complete